VRSVPGIKVGVVFDSSCPIDSERSDLRVMGFETRERAPEERQNEGQAGSTEFEIAMVYSNSVIKVRGLPCAGYATKIARHGGTLPITSYGLFSPLDVTPQLAFRKLRTSIKEPTRFS